MPLCLHDSVIKSPPAAIQLWTIYRPKMSAGRCPRNYRARLRRSGHCRHVKRINKSSRVSPRWSQYISPLFFFFFLQELVGVQLVTAAPHEREERFENLRPAKFNSCAVTWEFLKRERRLTSRMAEGRCKRAEACLVFSCGTGKILKACDVTADIRRFAVSKHSKCAVFTLTTWSPKISKFSFVHYITSSILKKTH